VVLLPQVPLVPAAAAPRVRGVLPLVRAGALRGRGVGRRPLQAALLRRRGAPVGGVRVPVLCRGPPQAAGVPVRSDPLVCAVFTPAGIVAAADDDPADPASSARLAPIAPRRIGRVRGLEAGGNAGVCSGGSGEGRGRCRRRRIGAQPGGARPVCGGSGPRGLADRALGAEQGGGLPKRRHRAAPAEDPARRVGGQAGRGGGVEVLAVRGGGAPPPLSAAGGGQRWGGAGSVAWVLLGASRVGEGGKFQLGVAAFRRSWSVPFCSKIGLFQRRGLRASQILWRISRWLVILRTLLSACTRWA
jgi:hypothetical protein